MCNAWNHRPGCRCGFGGEGHLGGGHGGSFGAGFAASPQQGYGSFMHTVATAPSSSGRPHSYGSSIRKQAADCGHSLLFPAVCRYCRGNIWLFATAIGGFTIFDDPFPPWPKHSCGGVDPGQREYFILETFFQEEDAYAVSVPADPPRKKPRPATRRTGTIVDIKPHAGERAYSAQLRTHEALYQIWVDDNYVVGTPLTGVVYADQERLWLREVQIVELPNPQQLEDLDSEPRKLQQAATPLNAARREVRGIEAYAGGSKNRAVVAALDAFSCEKPLTTVAILGGVLRVPPSDVAPELKARCARALFSILQDQGLVALAPTIQKSWISRGMSTVLDSHSRAYIQRIVVHASLRAGGTRESLRENIDRQLALERPFIETLATTRLPIIRSLFQEFERIADSVFGSDH